MTDDDIRFELGIVLYERYLETIEVATEEQSRFADQWYYFLRDLQQGCDLYKNNKIEKPENHIKKVIEEK